MSVALYLDRTSEEIEKLLLTYPVEGVEYKFLNPFFGPKGTLEEADYYLATNYKVTEEVMAQSPKLKLVARTGVGYENVDLKYAAGRNIPVTIAQGGNAISVAEFVIGLMLDLSRKITLLDGSTKRGLWQCWEYRHVSYEIAGKTLGIIGAGTIGREIMKRIQSLEVNCIYYDIRKLTLEEEKNFKASYADIDDLLQESDFVLMMMPCNESTVDFMGKEQFKLMKKTAFIINDARGPVINEDALCWALDNDEIAGAALDVFNKSPLGPGHRLLKYPNVITTPHLGGATLDAYKRIFSMCAENIQLVENGQRPKYIVNGL